MVDYDREITGQLDVIERCSISTDGRRALLAGLPNSRYPYVYPRDVWAAVRLFSEVALSDLSSSERAFTLLREVAAFIAFVQREDGHWGQRYEVSGEDKSIYRQEDNVAHGGAALATYLLTANALGREVPDWDELLERVLRGAQYALKNYYRPEIHLFYSTTSVHESAMEKGYSLWVNFAYLQLLYLMAELDKVNGHKEEMDKILRNRDSFRQNLFRIFDYDQRFVRRLTPDGAADFRPDITLLSPFYFRWGREEYSEGSRMVKNHYPNTVEFLESSLWSPEFGLLQRYLPFNEDMSVHAHAGNGPWFQYTAILAQYYYFMGNRDRGDEILRLMDQYRSEDDYLPEHISSCERFWEFIRTEWETGNDARKEFGPEILLPNLPYDLIVEELVNMKKSYDGIRGYCTLQEGGSPFIRFSSPLMWAHAEYAMALLVRRKAGYPAVISIP
ncbi:MAG: hypothetical protein QGF68_11705 [Nitrospinota bacterium]|jgi:GH15 family glucan-1,4-alpha-glucosidase|nr:hypothetical protein [Nitrospinota bacterium]